MSDPAEFRAEFPVLERVSYLNAGTNGPVPRRGVEAAKEWMLRDLEEGRSAEQRWAELGEAAGRLRARLATLLGCDKGQVALTRSTTDGVNAALSVIELGPGDEVVTSDEEHPGVIAPLRAGAARRGFQVTEARLAELAEAVGERTKLVACSHVSWITGRIADTGAIASSGTPLLLDGAQGLGAIALDMRALGCDFYAASGQKWLCGPESTGCLYVRDPAAYEPPWSGYHSLGDGTDPSRSPWHDDARRFDTGSPAAHQLAWSLAALDVLEQNGREWLFERARSLADLLAERLEDRGAQLVPRSPTTLVSWHREDAEELVRSLAAESIVIRSLPGRGLVRASVGAWSSEDELERLAGLAA